MQLTLLGTYGGPPPNPHRMGISSVVRVAGRNYVVDCGRGSVSQYARAGLKFADLTSILVTHLHPDHTAELFNFLQLPATEVPPTNDEIKAGLTVWGPPSAESLPAPHEGFDGRLFAPDSPTPGVRELIELSGRAFAYGNNILSVDHPYPAHGLRARVQELPVPEGADAQHELSPRMSPFEVFADDAVRVTATLVSHPPVFPAYAFRFDSAEGAIVFSGDTGVSENLIELAQDCDILVHEAVRIDQASGMDSEKVRHMREAHVLVEEVGQVAERAGAKRLVLSHIADFTGVVNTAQWRALAQDGFSGEAIVGADLQQFTVNSSSVRRAGADFVAKS